MRHMHARGLGRAMRIGAGLGVLCALAWLVLVVFLGSLDLKAGLFLVAGVGLCNRALRR